jgi:hypothetical protein
MVHKAMLTASRAKGTAMPHFWQVDSDLWINPAHIVSVHDDVVVANAVVSWEYSAANKPLLGVKMVAVASSFGRDREDEYTLVLDGEARAKLLAYLARETESAPPPAPE